MSKDMKVIHNYKKEMMKILSLTFPNMKLKEIEKIVDKEISSHLINTKCFMHNNYKNKTVATDLLSLMDWYYEKNPITAESGVFFKKHSEEVNPNAQMLRAFMKSRKKYKLQMYQFPEGAPQFKFFDRKQIEEKVNVNAFYGSSGEKNSIFYNLHSATSTTLKGQALISTAALAFENFLSNNVKFVTLDDCLIYIKNIVDEKRKLDDSDYLDKNVNKEQVLKVLYDKFLWKHPDEESKETIKIIVNGLKQQDLNRIYYKNNLYRFCVNISIKNKINNVIRLLKINNIEFKDPNKIPDIIKDEMKDLWDIISEFVFYNYMIFDRVNKLKHYPRKSVIVIDTDSNMLNLASWVDFNHIILDKDLKDISKNMLNYAIINILATLCSNMIKETMETFTKLCNVDKEERATISMKNEYLFKRMLLTTSKKNYAAVIELKEGHPVNGKVDIKGLPFMKTSVNPTTREVLGDILEKDILKSDKINIPNILKKLEQFEYSIRESLNKGERKFCKPVTVQDIESYDDPYRIQGVKALLVWNAVYPDQEIQFPAKIDLVKVNLNNEENLTKLNQMYPDIYKTLMDEIMSKPEYKMGWQTSGDTTHYFRGIDVIAIPKDVLYIPEWIRPFIDYNTIVNDNTTNFIKVLNSLGIKSIYSTKIGESFSNILSL